MRNKKSFFKLNPEWVFKEPIDFEYNKYTLLDYLQKCEKNFDSLMVYPDFVELSLHLANLQSLIKENTMLLTEKKFNGIDDEILLKEIYSKKPPKLTEIEKHEVEQTLRFSTNKMYDTFNLGKSVWNMAFDSIKVSIKKNKNSISSRFGYICFFDKKNQQLSVWEYVLSDDSHFKYDINSKFTIIFDDKVEKKKLTEIIDNNTTWKDANYKKFPVLEVKSDQSFPKNETFIPLMKRKAISFIIQKEFTINTSNFDK